MGGGVGHVAGVKACYASGMKNLSYFALPLLLLSTMGFSTGVTTVGHVDLEKYLGRWYEIARFPFKQQEGCHNTVAEYSKNEDGTIQVKNHCQKGSFKAPESIAIGTAHVVDAASNAKLKVRFFELGPWGDYWVIRLGEHYEYAVVSQPSQKFLWILSRTPSMNRALYNDIVGDLNANGFDTSLLEKTPQDWSGLSSNSHSYAALLTPYFNLLPLSLTLMTLLWLLSLVMKDASIVDRFWGVGFLALYVTQLLNSRFLTFRGSLFFVLVAAWGIRLSVYIQMRNSGKEEDPRYQKMRREMGRKFWWTSLFTVFWLQGLILWIVAAPLIWIHLFPQSEHATWLDVVGVVLWTTGFCFETTADFQMSRFKKDPKNRGQVCEKGVWGLSRHPNYFGESLIWWGFFAIAANASRGYLTIFSPLLITYLLLKVSGVSLLEKQLTQTKPKYSEYIKNVPAFFPKWKGRGLN